MRIARALRPIAVAVALATLSGLTGIGDASAQDVQGLQAKADRLAAELDKLEVRASQLDEEFLATGEQLAGIRSQISQNEAATAEAQARMDAAEAQASGFVVNAYMGLGAGAQVTLGAGDPNEAVSQRVLVETVQGDRQQLADELRAARMDLEDRTAELAVTTRDLDAKQARQSSIKAELDSTVNQQRELFEGANAELQTAVRAEQERRAAEAAARAEAAERARLEAARLAQQRSAQQAASRATSTTAAAPAGRRTVSPPAVAPRPAAPKPVAPPPAPVSAPNGRAAGAIAAAQSVLGTPYRWGGSSPSTGFDCSGLLMWAWASVGVSLPHSSRSLYATTQRVSMDQLAPGDLVFYGSPIHHVGMYIGGGQMIHSPRTGKTVEIVSIHRSFGTAVGAGRIR